MTWIRLEDTFFTNKKILLLTPEAKLLHLEAICYSSQHLTDGVIPVQVLIYLRIKQHQRAIKRLIDAGLWSIKSKDEYQIVNYLEYQTSKEQVEKVKQATKNRVEAHRKRKAGNADVTPLQEQCNADVTLSEPEPQTEPELEPEIKKKIKVIKDDPIIEDPDFKVFWAAYPKKVKRQNALKSYMRALKVATPQEIFEGVIRYSRTCGDDLKFVANPDGWLNQIRWNDINPQVKVEGTPSQSSNHFEAPAVGQYGVKVCSLCETQWPCAEMQKRGVK